MRALLQHAIRAALLALVLSTLTGRSALADALPPPPEMEACRGTEGAVCYVNGKIGLCFKDRHGTVSCSINPDSAAKAEQMVARQRQRKSEESLMNLGVAVAVSAGLGALIVVFARRWRDRKRWEKDQA